MKTLQILTVILSISIYAAFRVFAQVSGCPNKNTITIKKLPDTGQTRKYSLNMGEDADYTINPPSLTVNPNGTVTDNVTGLMWQQADGGEMTFEQAAPYCSALRLGGFSDWRLPTCLELFSILNHSLVNPALDPAVFTRSAAEYWWTCETRIDDATKVWAANAGGGIGAHPKTETRSAGGTKSFNVRAVRTVTPPQTVQSRFVRTTFGTVSDVATGLMWLGNPLSDSLTWEQALAAARNLTTGGFSDWRLPNVKELQSLNDETALRPSVNTQIFSGFTTARYWASTTLPNQTSRAWFLDTEYGIVSYDDKTKRLRIVAVRGGLTTPTSVANEAVGFSPNNSCTLAPNPARDNVMLRTVGSPGRLVRWQLVNVLGVPLQKREWSFADSGEWHDEIKTADLASGAYYVIFETSNIQSTQNQVTERVMKLLLLAR